MNDWIKLILQLDIFNIHENSNATKVYFVHFNNFVCKSVHDNNISTFNLLNIDNSWFTIKNFCHNGWETFLYLVQEGVNYLIGSGYLSHDLDWNNRISYLFWISNLGINFNEKFNINQNNICLFCLVWNSKLHVRLD